MRRGLLVLLAGVALAWSSPGESQDRVVEVSFTPTERAQIAVWIESADGTFLRTIRLTEATARRGIGNRPGALQMNSGFHWPYGRREGVLPVWAHRRVTAQEPFRRVIFQDRLSEGFASRTSNDASPDDYYCLSFNQATTTRDALDAVTCASQFNSDKGRYITDDDVERGYAEPFEMEGGDAMEMRQLDATSLYPPRRDLREARGADHPDVLEFADDVREVMPEIDAVTMATPPGAEEWTVQFMVPADWPAGDYVIYAEVNVEGDYNEMYDPERFPTPSLGGTTHWDYWAQTYGYPYRGQPSVVFEVPFTLDSSGGTYVAEAPVGYGSVQGRDGDIRPIDGTIADDPTGAPGSGADRFMAQPEGERLAVVVVPSNVCEGEDPPPQCGMGCDGDSACGAGFLCDAGECVGICDVDDPPMAVGELFVEPHEERSWDQAHVSFLTPESRRSLRSYQVRVARVPFEPGMDFGSWGNEAKIAGLEDVALVVPTDAAPGERIEVDLGHLTQQNTYYVGVRAVDSCGAGGEVQVAELETTEIIFTTVSPCFVATATYGTPMASEIGALRRFRDRYLMSHAFGRWLVERYYAVGPDAADEIREDEDLRAISRAALSPVVEVVRWLVD